jgi:glycosyltransferase involved in cell wall biosynthesis
VNVLVFSLGVDAAHSALGHTTAWTNELARRCEHVSVITMFAGELAVDRNVTVYSLGKELGHSEPRRLVEFYRLVRRVLSERPIEACFAHMAPLFTVLFAPVARLRRVPVLLWYAHTSVTPTLRMAHAMADRCVTATPTSFPLPSDKLFVVGHGIDTDRFTPSGRWTPSYETTATCVGRISPIKRVHEIVEAIGVLQRERGLELRLEIVGGPATATDHAYLAQLRQLVCSLGLEQQVEFCGPVPFYEMPPVYHRGLLSLNLSGTALDKTILESMASGCIPVSRNPAFQALAHTHELDWLVPARGPNGLADCITGALRLGQEERRGLVASLRRIVTDEHSLNTLGDRLITHLSDLAETSRARAPSMERH